MGIRRLATATTRQTTPDSACPSPGSGAAADITISLHSGSSLWRPALYAPGGTWILDEAVGESIIDRVSVMPRSSRFRLVVSLSSRDRMNNADASSAIRAAVRADFARRREAAEYQLRRTRRTGWVSLLVATTVLLVLVSVVEAIHQWAPPGRIARMLEQGFTIVAWVTFWRPAELLLYDQWPIRRDIELFRRIECAEVHVVATPPPREPA
jgi:hypothetical protein